jgi:hypothetical protein
MARIRRAAQLAEAERLSGSNRYFKNRPRQRERRPEFTAVIARLEGAREIFTGATVICVS